MPNDGSQISPDGSGQAGGSSSQASTGSPGQTSTDSFVETPGQVWVAKTDLKPGAVGLTGAIMQNVTHIAPAIAAFFFTATIVTLSRGGTPRSLTCSGSSSCSPSACAWSSWPRSSRRRAATTPMSAGRSALGSDS